jgi:proteasome lid subunit RPN8/RPN11
MRFEKDIIFTINKEIISRINNCIEESYPNEACGFLFGSIREVNNHGDFKYTYYCEFFHCIESGILSPASFVLDNDDKILELSNNIVKNKSLKLLGIFHSHPAGANPSSFDKKSMKYYHNCGIEKFKHLVWIIVDSRNKNINGFMYLENKLTQIRVIVNK